MPIIIAKYQIRCTPLIISVLFHSLYVRRYCRITINSLRQQLLQNHLSIIRQQLLQNYSLTRKPLVKTGQNYPLYVGRLCRITLLPVGQQLKQKYTIHYTSVDLKKFNMRCIPVVISEHTIRITSEYIADLHYSLYVSRYYTN